jgi:RimJ/RimL family protein N-acetyltransferase
LIYGNGLLLRRWRESDAELFARVVAESVEHLRPWIEWIADEPRSVEQRRTILAGQEREWAAGGGVHFAILVDGAVAGACGLNRRDCPGVVEIGYWTHPLFLRRGVATRAVGLLPDAALAMPDIEHVEIHHDKANIASAGVPRRLGFTFVGEARREPQALADSGIECGWRTSRATWRDPVRRMNDG